MIPPNGGAMYAGAPRYSMGVGAGRGGPVDGKMNGAYMTTKGITSSAMRMISANGISLPEVHQLVLLLYYEIAQTSKHPLGRS